VHDGLGDEVWFFLRLETMGLEQKRELDLGWGNGAKRILEGEGLMLRTGERE